MRRVVKYVTPDAWQRSYDLAAPHGKFCGVGAQMQLKKGLHFICEQPAGSDLYYEHPWLVVLNRDMTDVWLGSKPNMVPIREFLSRKLPP